MNNYPYRDSNNSSDDAWSWVAIVVSFAIFWPLGLFLLFRKIFGFGKSGGSSKHSSYGAPYSQSGRVNPSRPGHPYAENRGARPYKAYNPGAANAPGPAGVGRAPGAPAGAPSARQSTPVSSVKRPTGKLIALVLLILAIIFFVFAASSITGAIGSLVSVSGGRVVWEFIRGGFYLVGGGASLIFRNAFLKRQNRYTNYFAAMGKSAIMSVTKMSGLTGFPMKTVRKDLTSMAEHGLFGDSAYFDTGLDSIVLSLDAAEQARSQRQTAESTEARAEAPGNEYMSILTELRTLNDKIVDPVISDRISHIEELAGKIFRLVEEHPEKQPRIRKFMDYYLPSTLKLLRSYATLEHQGIEGSNISSAKQDIAKILDTLSSGYEQQLDSLFRDDALDISADVDVLKVAMERDGLNGTSSPFSAFTGTSGAAAAKQQDSGETGMTAGGR